MTWGNNGMLGSIEIPEGLDCNLDKSIFIENPFVISKNIIKPDIEIYSMGIEIEPYPIININASVSCEYICEARNNSLNDLCSILVKDNLNLPFKLPIKSDSKFNIEKTSSSIRKFNFCRLRIILEFKWNGFNSILVSIFISLLFSGDFIKIILFFNW